MILSYNQILAQQSVFHNRVESTPEDWRSRMPADVMALAATVGANPAAATIGELVLPNIEVSGGFNRFWATMGNQGLQTYVTASRQMIGEMFQTVGVLSRSMPLVGDIFNQQADKAFSALNVLSGIANSPMFGKAINTLGYVPVAGWIVKLVVNLSKMVTTFVSMARDEDDVVARAMAARQITIPMSATQFSTQSDEYITQRVLGVFRESAQIATQTLIRAPYSGRLIAEGVYDDGAVTTNRDKSMSLGWVMRPETPSGVGFVPGTGNMTGALFMNTSLTKSGGYGSSLVRDLGSLYPTATGLLNNWWSMVLEPGPAMFTVNPLSETTRWETYIREQLVLAESMRGGWSVLPTGIPFTNKFWCIKGDPPNQGMEGVGGCKRSTRGDRVTIPKDFGLAVHNTLVLYLYKLYFGVKSINDRAKYYDPDAGTGGIPLINDPSFYENARFGLFADPDSVDVGESIPVRALRNLHEQQMAVLQSIDCMYVDGERPGTFPAFAQNNRLARRWAESVNAILQSNDWRRVSYKDVPEGHLKTVLAEVATKAGINPESLPDRNWIATGPSVLGDPTRPKAPPLNDVDPIDPTLIKGLALKGGRGKKAKTGGGGGLILGAAAVAAALLVLKK